MGTPWLRRHSRLLAGVFLVLGSALWLAACQASLPASQAVVSPTAPARDTAAPAEPLVAETVASPIVQPSPTRPAPSAVPTSAALATAAAQPAIRPPNLALSIMAQAVFSSSVGLETDEVLPVYGYRVVDIYPHDPGDFTQGLVYVDGVLYEGTGQYGRSGLEKKDLETGQTLHELPLPDIYFGEGMTVLGDKIYQLTWREHTGFVYDKETFQLLATWSYPGEGWGLTHDGQQLIMSDGTDVLTFIDPETLQIVGRVQVQNVLGRPLAKLNELEYVDGEVYANIWTTDIIARIDPTTGEVLGLIDLSNLLPLTEVTAPVDVLNGIAYDAAGGRLFVTGKLWPKLYEIDLTP